MQGIRRVRHSNDAYRNEPIIPFSRSRVTEVTSDRMLEGVKMNAQSFVHIFSLGVFERQNSSIHEHV